MTALPRHSSAGSGAAALFQRLGVLLAFVLLAGCRSQIVDTGFLQGGYEAFNAVEKYNVKVRLDESIAANATRPDIAYVPGTATLADDSVTTRSVAFIVEEPRWTGNLPFTDAPEKRTAILFTLRERLYRYLLRNYPHPARVRYAYLESDEKLRDYRILTIRSAITDYKLGHGVSRWLVGYGAGQCRVQVEGQIFEGVENPRLVGEFVVRTAHGGYAQNGWNRNVLYHDYVLKYAIDEAIVRLTRELPAFIPAEEWIAAPGR